jgi:NMD protein affecting ribosome stability and mRNA decay
MFVESKDKPQQKATILCPLCGLKFTPDAANICPACTLASLDN